MIPLQQQLVAGALLVMTRGKASRGFPWQVIRGICQAL